MEKVLDGETLWLKPGELKALKKQVRILGILTAADLETDGKALYGLGYTTHQVYVYYGDSKIELMKELQWGLGAWNVYMVEDGKMDKFGYGDRERYYEVLRGLNEGAC